MNLAPPPWSVIFAHPVTVWIVAGIVGALILAAIVTEALSWAGAIRGPLRFELWLRIGAWSLFAPAVIAPVLAGRTWTIIAVTALGLVCLAGYARDTGLFRSFGVASLTVIGIVAVNLAALDRWWGLFLALVPLTALAIALVAIASDRPQGYVHRVALGIFAFVLFGVALAHLGYMANDSRYRPIVLLLLVAAGMSDVFDYGLGKALGGPRLLPRTSPEKTLFGAAAALLLTVFLAAAMAQPVFAGGALEHRSALIGLGLIIAVAAQLGDLVLSAIKRDSGMLDMDSSASSRGGILDRFNGLLLVAPAIFHYIDSLGGFDFDAPVRGLF